MKWISVVFAALMVLLSACSDKGFDQATATYIDSVMSASFKPNAPGAVILVAKNGVPVFRKAYGIANLELKVPNKPEHVFAIASMTKQFTAVCMLQLVQQGKVSLGDDIRKYLPEYNTHGRTITIENLLTHTNGIPNVTMAPGFERMEVFEPSQEDIMGSVIKDPLLFEPGSDWSYNDVGYSLAAFIIQRVSGMPMSDYLQRNIFQPLGMKNSTVATRERTIPMFVTGYSSGGDTLFRPAQYFNWTWDYGMGDIVTTVDDMLKWDEALYSDKLVSRSLLEKAWTPFVLTDGRQVGYGYGWAVAQYKGLQVIHHAGGIYGFRSSSIRIPSQHLFVVILSNNGATGAAISLAEQIALKIAGKPLTPPPAVRLSRSHLEEYTGVYEVGYVGYLGILISTNMTHDKIYRYVTVEDTVVFSQTTGRWKTPLLEVGKDLFVFKGSNTYAHFQRNNKGEIISIEVYTEPGGYGPPRVEPKIDHPLPKEKVPVTLDEKILKRYEGKYNYGGDNYIRIRVDGQRIYIDTIGEIFPESETRFFSKVWAGTIEFTKKSSGVVTGVILTSPGKYQAKKVE